MGKKDLMNPEELVAAIVRQAVIDYYDLLRAFDTLAQYDADASPKKRELEGFFDGGICNMAGDGVGRKLANRIKETMFGGALKPPHKRAQKKTVLKCLLGFGE